MAIDPVRSRSRWVRGCLVAALLVPIATGVAIVARDGSTAAAAEGRPNVVVIMTDDQTAESMRVMAQTRAVLGDQGATFTNSFVNLPLCCPSRATFLTGLYAHNHEVLTNAWPNGGFYKFDPDYGQRNLATALQGAGYYTALVGKHLNQYGEREADPAAVPDGWSEWHATLAPNPDAYNYTLNEDGVTTAYGGAPDDFKTDVLTAKAVDLVARRLPAPEPLFLWLSYTAPHGGGPDPSPQPPFDCDPGTQPASRHATAFDAEPLPTPPNFNEADVSDKPPSIRNSPLLDAATIESVQGRYRCSLESLLSVDEGVRDVVAEIGASGELDNTLIVFTSDNGFFNGEHRDAQGKGTHYDPATRVPLLMRGPGVPAGAVRDQPVVNADLAPTILDAADAAPPVAYDGQSLLPLFSPAAQWQRKELLLENRTYSVVRTDRYVYAEHTSGEDAGAIELYDTAADPYEVQNVHGVRAYRSIEAQLAGRLSTLRACTGATCSPPPLYARTASPVGVVVQTGSHRAGSAGSLSADDDSYYEVNSNTSKTRTSSWYGRFDRVPNALSGLEATYKGKNSDSCTQRLYIKRWTDESWVQLDSRSVGGSEVLVEVLPSGSAANYVSGTAGDGEVQLRVQCTAKKGFYARGDLMRIEYLVP